MRVGARTIVCASLANPNRASLAPGVHNAAFAHLGLDYVYLAFEPADIGSALKGVRALGIRGVSISRPFKEIAAPFMDELDSHAAKIGALNTVLNTGRLLRGYNSDWIGGIRALQEVTDLAGRSVSLLGAGGAARAIAYGLRRNNAVVTVFNRTPSRARRLADDLGVHYGGGLAEAAPSEILINATSIGVGGKDDVPVSDELLTSRPVVLDIVIHPSGTRLMARASALGCRTVAGDRMFVHQGAVQLELFTGMAPPLDVMSDAVGRLLKTGNV